MKLRPRILSLVIGILIVSFLALSIPLYWYARSALEDELDKRLLSIAEIAAHQLRNDLLANLAREPALATVRATLEQDLSAFRVEGIEGLAVYTPGGVELASSRATRPDQPDISVFLQSAANLHYPVERAVSGLYRLSEAEYFKAAAISMEVGAAAPLVLVVWGGADFMTVIDQIIGSLFWIVLVSVVVAVSLAAVFSRSLIRPVMELSAYAKSIQKNIHSEPVDLGRTDEFGDLNRALSEMHTEVRQHERSMKQLLSSIAHEIKNPLGGMEIYTGLLEESLSREAESEELADHRTYLEKVTRELRHLKQIVLEYLDYAKPLKSHLEPLQVELIFEDILRILQPEIRQKEVAYQISGEGVVQGDESKLRRVFVNLLKNSLEAVERKSTIDITIEGRDHELSVVISDNGRGIPQADLGNIFDPYFTTREKGYGLGLTIAKNIIDEMNGTILVESVVGQGTTFTLRFPGK
ncbi:MAG: HAMP domain-containing histidine kinase [Candidatus Marinimicrobia bacterium]|nr:HAMP domain-containing histidine kinase [Candidatus Neomarinimicrobiota bacterium]